MLKRFCGAALGLCLVSLLAPACRADEVTAAMRKADVRLQTRITLISPRILIGEMLERLSKQSSVTLTADAWSTTGSDSVAVSFRDVPLADAMNALWSLFSYKHMEWDWRHSAVKGAEGQYAYTLARPDYARFQAERLQEQVQTDFEAQAQKMLAALDMTPDQLKEAAKHDLLMDSLLDDGRVGPGIRILASLPPETLQNVVQDRQPLSIPVSELSPDAQKALQASWDWEDARGVGRVLPDGKVVPLPRDNHIGIYIFHESDLVAPALYIETGRGSGQFFGGSYLEKPWRQKMNAEWMQPGDAPDDPAALRSLAAWKPAPSANQPHVPVSLDSPMTWQQTPQADQPHALADYLLRFSDAAQVPMIARIPHALDSGTNLSTIAQVFAHLASQKASTKTVTGFLEGVQEAPVGLEHKWRGGVLLLTCQNWFVDESENARLPWTEVKRLRDTETAGDGLLSLNDLAHAAAVLNVAQMHRLGEWFPAINSAAEWRDFLAFYDKTSEYRPRVLSATGDAFQYPESLVNAQLGIDALRVTHPNLRLQIQQKQTDEKPPTRRILFMVRDDDGVKPIGGQGFSYAAHEYQTSLKVDEGTPKSGKNLSAAK